MNEKVKKSLFIILIGIWMWTIFIFQNELANYGLYTIIDWSFYEVMTAIPLFFGIGSVVWFIKLMIKSRKTKTFNDNKIILVTLFFAIILQLAYVINSSNQVETSMIAYVVSIDQNNSEIVIMKNENMLEYDTEEIKLECPIVIIELLQEGEQYMFTYTTSKDKPNEGVVLLAQNGK